MDITYIGHSSFRIKGKTATIITDPFDPSMVGLKFPVTDADIVTISHNHEDHNKIDLVKNTSMVINGPGEYEVKEVSVIGISSYHDDKKGEERGKNTIYVYEIDDVTIAHLGDLGHSLSADVLEEIGSIDILMIPVGGKYTIDAAEAVKVVQSIEPSIIIPMHYRMEGMADMFGELAPVTEFLTNAGLPSETLDKFSIKKGEFSEEQKIIVLEKK